MLLNIDVCLFDQEILYWQHLTMEGMYTRIGNALKVEKIEMREASTFLQNKRLNTSTENMETFLILYLPNLLNLSLNLSISKYPSTYLSRKWSLRLIPWTTSCSSRLASLRVRIRYKQCSLPGDVVRFGVFSSLRIAVLYIIRQYFLNRIMD